MRGSMLTVALVGLLGCGADAGVGVTGAVVGGPCTVDQDCALGSECLTSGDFPGGTCSLACLSDLDCPMATACVKKEGRRCLLTCLYPTDCRPGYTCKAVDRAGTSGQALVCLKD